MQTRIVGRGFGNWVSITCIALAMLLVVLFLGSLLAPRVADAAPPRQVHPICDLLPKGGKDDGGKNPSICGMNYKIGDYGHNVNILLTKWSRDIYGDRPPIQVVKDAEVLDCSKSPCSKNNLGDYGFTSRDSHSCWVEWAEGCYVVTVATNDGDVVDKAFALASEVAQTLKTQPPCSFGTSAQPPTAQPPAADTFSISHGCSYNEPGISQGQVVCVANATNATPGADITYKWTLDDQVQPETGPKFTRSDKDLSAGEHTLVIAATEAKSSPPRQASSSYSFTKAGADPYVSVQCALRSGDDRAVACYADPKNMPDGAVLTYEWTWNNAPAGDGTRTLSKNALLDGLYTIQVRAKDGKSGKTTPLASTSIRVGPPPSAPTIKIEDVWNGINTFLTGKPSPNPPDPAAVATAASGVAVALGFGALLNGLTSLLGGAAPAASPDSVGAVQQTSTLNTKPDTQPEDMISPPVKPKPKPTDLPEIKPPDSSPQLTPEQKAIRRQQADQKRQQGMAEGNSAWWGQLGTNIGYYGTTVVSCGADVSVDVLSNLTGGVGKTIKNFYTTVKDVGVGMAEGYYNSDGVWVGGLKGLGNAAVDYGFSNFWPDRLKLKLKPHPLETAGSIERGMRDPIYIPGWFSVFQGTAQPYESNSLFDVLLTRAGHSPMRVIREATDMENPARAEFVRKRLERAVFDTLHSQERNFLIKDPVKFEIGLKDNSWWGKAKNWWYGGKQ